MSTNDRPDAESERGKDVDQARARLLDGLMASSLPAWDASLYRTRLFAGYGDPYEEWVHRSFASFRERAGRLGTLPADAHALPFNNQVKHAHARLKVGGYWERERRRTSRGAEEGPRTPWQTQLRDVFPQERPPARTTLRGHQVAVLALLSARTRTGARPVQVLVSGRPHECSQRDTQGLG